MADTIERQDTEEQQSAALMHSVLQRIATGPELSKDISLDEARLATRAILQSRVSDVQAALFFIALRMKRETDDENKGVLQALRDSAQIHTAAVDEVVDVADPYDGYVRGLPASPFLPAVLAACGLPAVSHGAEAIGPKFGITHRKVLRAAGSPVDLQPAAAAARLADPATGWAYVDQYRFAPQLHALAGLRVEMVKRPVLTTLDVLLGPVRGATKTHLLTGFVHKAYPRVYRMLARHAGFSSALIVRGVEGGVTPNLQQEARFSGYVGEHEVEEQRLDPGLFGIEKAPARAVPLPARKPVEGDKPRFDVDTMAAAAAHSGLAALEGEAGLSRESLVLTASLVLLQLGRVTTPAAAAARVRSVLDDGSALDRFRRSCRL